MARYLRLSAPLLATAALGWCVVAGWWMWTTPVRWVGLASDPAEPAVTVQVVKYERFEDVSGLGAVPLLIPVALTGIATLASWRRRPLIVLALGLILFGYGVLTGFSIGGAYMPSAVAVLVAGFVALWFSPR